MKQNIFVFRNLQARVKRQRKKLVSSRVKTIMEEV